MNAITFIDIDSFLHNILDSRDGDRESCKFLLVQKEDKQFLFFTHCVISNITLLD